MVELEVSSCFGVFCVYDGRVGNIGILFVDWGDDIYDDVINQCCVEIIVIVDCFELLGCKLKCCDFVQCFVFFFVVWCVCGIVDIGFSYFQFFLFCGF